MDLTCSEPRPGVLALSGELTFPNATALRDALLGALSKSDRLEVDLLNVTKLDTAGVQLLILVHREAARLGRPLVWLGYSLAVEEVFDLLDLRHLLGQPSAVVWS